MNLNGMCITFLCKTSRQKMANNSWLLNVGRNEICNLINGINCIPIKPHFWGLIQELVEIRIISSRRKEICISISGIASFISIDL